MLLILTYYLSSFILAPTILISERKLEKKILTSGVEEGWISLKDSKELYVQITNNRSLFGIVAITLIPGCLWFAIGIRIFARIFTEDPILLDWSSDISRYRYLISRYLKERKRLSPEKTIDFSFLEAAEENREKNYEHKQLLAKVDDLVK